MKIDLEKSLKEVEEAGIIELVETSQWGTPLVPIPKPDGTIRICAGYKISF